MSGNQNVLYIDDEPLLKMAFVETLKQQGYLARGAVSGKEALAMIEEETPDVIILDVMMKPMDGWETLTHIKNLEKSRNVPVIMQTGKSLTIKDVVRYGDLIEDYLIKPVRLPDLVRAIEGVSDRRKTVQTEADTAVRNGRDPALIDEYSRIRHRSIINRRLIEILSRIYPIRTEGEKIESDFDMPELQEIISRFERDLKRCGELKQELLG